MSSVLIRICHRGPIPVLLLELQLAVASTLAAPVAITLNAPSGEKDAPPATNIRAASVCATNFHRRNHM